MVFNKANSDHVDRHSCVDTLNDVWQRRTKSGLVGIQSVLSGTTTLETSLHFAHLAGNLKCAHLAASSLIHFSSKVALTMWTDPLCSLTRPDTRLPQSRAGGQEQ